MSQRQLKELQKNIGYIFKKEYLKIISFIPHHILDVNDLMIYKNIMEKQKNNYKI